MKIHIIGCSGTGKTYLAEKLSKKYSIPHFDLDDLQWDNTSNEYGVKTPIEKRNAMLQKILETDDWIIEGVYYSWVEDCFRDADWIYLIDIPPRVYKYRIVRRFIKRKTGIECGKKETLKSVLALIRWTDTWQKENLPKINAILDKYKNKTVRLKCNRDICRIITD